MIALVAIIVARVSLCKRPFDCVSCRQAKLDLRTATGKVEEMTRLLQSVQDQMQRKVRV